MEQTMFRHFVMGQRLRVLLQPGNIPPAVQDILPNAYQKRFKADIRGTFLHDMVAFDETFQKMPEQPTGTQNESKRLPDALYDLLCAWYDQYTPTDRQPAPHGAFFQTQIKRLGEVYRRKESVPDSYVVYVRGQSWTCGQIQELFSHTQPTTSGPFTRTFAVVHEFKPLSTTEESCDPFRRFAVAGGRLFHSEFKSQPILLNIDDIVCHASTCVIEDGDIHDLTLCLPMDR